MRRVLDRGLLEWLRLRSESYPAGTQASRALRVLHVMRQYCKASGGIEEQAAGQPGAMPSHSSVRRSRNQGAKMILDCSNAPRNAGP